MVICFPHGTLVFRVLVLTLHGNLVIFSFFFFCYEMEIMKPINPRVNYLGNLINLLPPPFLSIEQQEVFFM